ncbi:hypothetical protein EP7_004326 [Isosphaeraceae bacterium EP7]
MADITFHTHPQLVRNWERYQKIADFEDGEHDRVVSYLWKYGLEKDSNPKAQAHYDSRVERLHNDNFVEQYLRLHIGHMSQPIHVNGIEANERLGAIEKDVTGLGMSALLAAQERLRLYIRDGRVGTLIDSPAAVSQSKVEAIAEREQSYQVIYEATDIRYWERFTSGRRRGQLKSVILSAEPYLHKGQVHASFRRYSQPEAAGAPYRWEWMRTKLTTSVSPLVGDITCEVIDAGEGGVEGVPFVMWGNGPRESFVRSVVNQNCSHMNALSVRDNVLWYTGMQKNAFVGVTPEELDKWSEAAALMISNSEARIFTVESFDPVGLNNAIARLEKHIHRHGKFQYNQLADDTRQTQAADSKILDLKVQKDIYDKTLDRQTEVEREIWRWHARYERATPAEIDAISVSIARDYGFDDPAAEEAEHQAAWNEARELGAIKIQKQLLKARVYKMELYPVEGQTVEELRDELLGEIDALQARESRVSSAINGLGSRLFGGADGQVQA